MCCQYRGLDLWDNVAAACRRCNHFKAVGCCECSGVAGITIMCRIIEYLALINSGRILGDQMTFSKASAESRLRH